MKRIYRMGLAVFLGLSIIFTGCQSSSSANKEVAMGRYLEETIEFEGIDVEAMPSMCFFENVEGGIEAISKWSENTNFISKCYVPGDDKMWIEADEVLANSINKEHFYTLDSIQKDKQTGNLYVIGERESETEIKLENGGMVHGTIPNIARIKEDNTLEKVNIDWQSTAVPLNDVQIAQDNLFVMPGMPGETDVVQQYDLKTGKFIKELGENITDFTIMGNRMYTFCWEDEGVIKSYDINTGKEITSIKAINGFCEMIPSSDEKGIYLVDEGGIYYLAENEEISEQILDGARYSLSSPSAYVMGGNINDDIFYIQYMMDHNYVYKQYTYHDDIPSVPEETVTIFSLEACPALKRAAQIYMEQHPNVYVDVNVVNPDREPMDTEARRQAIEDINTQILAGAAADIIVLDGLPVEAYIEKGVLGDMTSVADEIQKTSSYYDNMIYAYKENDKLYALPLGFTIVSAVGESELLKDGFDLEALATYQKEHPEKQVLANMVPEELVEMMSSLWYSRIINSNGQVDTSELTRFLEAVNTLAPMKEGMADCYADRTCYRGARTFQAIDKEIRVMLDDSPNRNELQVLLHAKAQFDNGMITTRIQGQENLVNLCGLIGINATSDKKEAIQEILTTTFSKELAMKNDNILNKGISVQQDRAEELLLGEDTQTTAGSSDEVSTAKDWGSSFARVKEDGQMEIKDILTWYTEDVEYYIERLTDAKVLRPMDSKMLTIIQKESEDYFKGSISVDEAVQHIKEKIDIYLSEQNK